MFGEDLMAAFGLGELGRGGVAGGGRVVGGVQGRGRRRGPPAHGGAGGPPGERWLSWSIRRAARAAAAPARSVPVKLAMPIALPSATAKAAPAPKIRRRR